MLAVEGSQHLTLDGLANFAAAVLLDSKLLVERSTRKIWEGRPRSRAPKFERGSFGRTGAGRVSGSPLQLSCANQTYDREPLPHGVD